MEKFNESSKIIDSISFAPNLLKRLEDVFRISYKKIGEVF